MKSLIAAMGILLSASMGIAADTTSQPATQTGKITCTIGGKMGGMSNSAAIMQNADGTGGVAQVSLSSGGLICSAKALAKFEKKELFEISLEFGDVKILNRTMAKGLTSNMLQINEALTCLCIVE